MQRQAHRLLVSADFDLLLFQKYCAEGRDPPPLMWFIGEFGGSRIVTAGCWRGGFGLADRCMTQLVPMRGCRLVRVVRDGPSAITLVAEAKRDHARCPTCRAVSTSVHSRYRRRPADLPASGEAIRLQLEVRRLYCRNPACPRQTFAERFLKLLARQAVECENAMQLCASCGPAASLAPSSRSDSGCPSGAPARPGPRSGVSGRRCPWRPPHRRRYPHRSRCRGTSASRTISMLKPLLRSHACCRTTRLPRSPTSADDSVGSSAAAAAARRPSLASPPPSTLG